MNNPVRIAEKQKKYIKFVSGRYKPIFSDRFIGINFLHDENPGAPADYMAIGDDKDIKSAMDIEKPNEEKADDDMVPEDFEYDENKQLLDKKKE